MTPAARLRITPDGYALALLRADGAAEPLARWPGGAAGLLRGSVGEAAIEAAIERAEDWLMPHARALEGRDLHVDDATGRLRDGLQAVLQADAHAWDTPALEALFLRLVALATGRIPAPDLEARAAFVADVVLLRELAHHGRLHRLTLASGPPELLQHQRP